MSDPSLQSVIITEMLGDYTAYLDTEVVPIAAFGGAAQTLAAVFNRMMGVPADDAMTVLWDFFVAHQSDTLQTSVVMQGVSALAQADRYKFVMLYARFYQAVMGEAVTAADPIISQLFNCAALISFLQTQAATISSEISPQLLATQSFVTSHLTGVELISHKGAVSGYASLNGSGKVPASQLAAGNTVTFGTTSNTCAEGNDSRITGAELVSHKGVAVGYCELDSEVKIPVIRLPAVVIGSGIAAAAVSGAATMNAQNGIVTSEALTDATSYVLTLTNDLIQTTSTVVVCPFNGDTTGVQIVSVVPATGSVTITLAMATFSGQVTVPFTVSN